MKNIFVTLSLLLAVPVLCNGQLFKDERLISFETNNDLSYITTQKSKISISKQHYKDGFNSLAWSFSPKGELHISKDLGFEQKDATGVDTYLSTFTVWVYNENPMNDAIRFEFLKNGKTCSSFPLNIDFKGWRAVYVSYERDMAGVPQVGMNQIRVVAPDAKGALFFDLMITAAKADHRHHTPDIQLPFVNTSNDNHWLALYRYSLEKPNIVLQKKVSAEQKKEIATIEERLKELLYSPSKLSKEQLLKIKKEYARYDIKRKDDRISGLPLFFARSAEAFERIVPDWDKNTYVDKGMELRAYFDLMQRVATVYNNATEPSDREELEEIFINMYDHVTDQGVAYGSGLGNITHYGYSFRNFFTSYFLMKDVLSSTKRLSDASKAMQWYGMTNEVYIIPQKRGLDMDTFNTIVSGRIASILIMEDTPEKVQYLQSFSRWLDNGCQPAPGLDGAFKPDGATFHHRNNYPAYAVGGLTGATDMIYLLNNTQFAISESGHKSVKNVLMTMRFYCNKRNFPLSMSGRHPDGKGELVPLQYGRLAMAGSPDRSQKIDKKLGEAYLRLLDMVSDTKKPEYMPEVKTKTLKKLAESIIAENIISEKDPSGNIAIGYGAVSVQRRGNWSAVARGHSRYLWAAEHYLGANLYGRYLAHGSLLISTAKENAIVTPKTSGWIEEGFDWGRIPGTTAIHLPVEKLKANVLNVDTFSGYEEMLYSDEAFAGGLSQNKTNGSFAMKLHEHDKYNGSHRARKSYHFFDNRIICLGTSIENNIDKYNTGTTIFQLAVTDKADSLYWSRYAGDGKYWKDHLGTGYFIPASERGKVKFENNTKQNSKYQNSGEKNSGHWVNLFFDHGNAPENGSYEYMIVPQADEPFVGDAPYRVLQKDEKAHIVKDSLSNTISYALFETPSRLPQGVIQNVDTSCLIMLVDGKDKLELTVANPDLALYKGTSDDIFDNDGKRIERSIYSRPWISNECMDVPVVVTLVGLWKVNPNDKVEVLSCGNGKTVLKFRCREGASIDTQLTRAGYAN